MAHQHCLLIQAEESEPSDFEFEEEQAQVAAGSDEEDELSTDDESGMSLLSLGWPSILKVLCCGLHD